MSRERSSHGVTGPGCGRTVSRFPRTTPGPCGLAPVAEHGAGAPTSHPRVASPTLLRAKAEERPVPDLLQSCPSTSGVTPTEQPPLDPIARPARSPRPFRRRPENRKPHWVREGIGYGGQAHHTPMSATDSPRRLLPADWTPSAPRRSALAELGPRDQWPAQFTLEQAAEYMNVSATYLEDSGVPVVLLPTTGTRKLRRWRRKDLDKHMEEHLCRDRRTS